MTTIPLSTVPAVSTYLLGAIQAQVATDPLAASMLVKLGEAGVDLPNDIITIGEVRRRLTPRTFIGSGGLDWELETYDIEVFISTWTGSGDSDDTSVVSIQLNDRLWQLIGYVETAVRTDPSLGELVTVAYPASTTATGPTWPETGGLIAQAEMTVHAECLN